MSFDLNRGLEELAKYIAPGSEDWETFEVHKGKLLQNIQSKNLFGEPPTTSAERAAILYQLNPLALKYTGISFNDLAIGKVPTPADSPPANRPVVDLEILLTGYGEQRYQVDMQMMQPRSATPNRPMPETSVHVSFNQAMLIDGKALSDALFGQRGVYTGFDRARTVSQTLAGDLRVRLTISTSVNELHRIAWEKMNDPIETDKPLALSTLFSRYVSDENNLRPITPRPMSDIRGLMVLSNPSDISDFTPGGQPLARIDVPKIEASMKTALAGFQVDVLASGGEANVDIIRQKLQHTGYDILVIVAHGAFRSGPNKDIPLIWLETQNGKADVVEGNKLVQRLIGNIDRPPLLTVLASCQSAGDGALATLGPQLARAGMPAVVAMQDDITIGTLNAFLVAFFRELKRDGRVDRAMNEARLAVKDHHDWWVPVLFMRLRDGMIWQPRKGQSGGEQSTASSHQALPSGQPSICSVPKGAHVNWKTANIRTLLENVFDDETLVQFCFDHYRDVHKRLSRGMTTTAKVQELLEYCVRHNQVHTLLEQVKEINPSQFDQYAPYHS